MKARFRDSMTWLHSWSGLVVGWLLYAIFFTGTLSYFQDEITTWMQPESTLIATPDQAMKQAQEFLMASAPDSPQWSISLPTERSAITTLFWRNSSSRGFQRATLNGNGQEFLVRDTRGGSFFYRFHFDLHYIPVLTARWIVGICSMFMLVSIISGVIIHKKIFKDFFSFQPGKGPRSWLDAHTLTSVLALPFHLMITYTGLVTLMFLYLSWPVSLSFGDRNTLQNALETRTAESPLTGNHAELLPLQDLYVKASEEIDHAPISFVVINNPKDQSATIRFTEAPTRSLVSDYRRLTYSAVSGDLLDVSPVTNSADLTRLTMVNLHSGRFADIQLRWLYFFSGLLGTVMIASGLILWLKSRQKALKVDAIIPLGHHLVSGLNIGFILGLPLAVCVYLLANRLIPTGFNERAELEILCFFTGWLALILYSLCKGVKKTWRNGTRLTGLLYLSVPLVSIVTVERHLLTYEYPRDLCLVGVDIALLMFGSCLLYFFWRPSSSIKSVDLQPVPSKVPVKHKG